MSTMVNYEQTKASFKLETPDDYNFGFDVIDKRASQADKLAFITVDATASTVTHYQFSDLSKLSNQFANGLLSLEVKKGELAFVMIPRIAEWYAVMIGCCKLGVVTMPGTNLLTAKDIEYRVNRSKATVAIVTSENADKVDAIKKNCPTLQTLIVIGERRVGWHTFDQLISGADKTLERSTLESSKASDLMMIYFTSGTTGMPKMVPRDMAYAHAHTITGEYWMD
ncbi:MAG: AMP-binding protein, partial [Cycloclasticus sp.]|nr:AMP-binding protein [Cycloclasticus sp.]MBQ0789712.1 AMP-binding protein [Cycloclasticus sp.]